MRPKAPDFYRKRDPRTDEEWDALAKYKGVESGQVLKEQTSLADSILEEIFAEERAAKD